MTAQPWPRAVPPPEAPERPDRAERPPPGLTLSPGELAAAVWRRRLFLALWLALCLALAGWYLAVAPIIYSASATVILEPRQPLGPTLPGTQSAAAQALDIAQAESQIQVVRSERILSAVFDTLALNNAPDFAEPPPGLRQRLLTALGLDEPDRPAPDRGIRAFQAFSDRVGVRRLGQSYVLEVSYQAPTPEQAARVANAVAVQYVKAQIDVKAAAAQQGTEYLRGRITAIEAEQRAAAEGVREGRVPDVQFSDADARIIGAALRPINKSYPKTGLTLAFALTFGLLTGLLAVAVRHALDRTLRTRRQVRLALGVECLGVLPKVAGLRDLRRRGLLPLVPIAPKHLGSPFTQALLSASTAILMQGPTDRRRIVIGVASWSRGEGRSTLAAALAQLLSVPNDSVDLIDADLQRPTLTKAFAPTAEAGLTEMLLERGAEGPPSTITLSPTMGIVPAVGADRRAGPNLFLGAEPMRRLLVRMRATRNLVVDLPPLATASNAQALCPHLDGVVLVVEAGRTTIEEAAEAVRLLQAADGRVFGVILNKAPPERGRRRAG